MTRLAPVLLALLTFSSVSAQDVQPSDAERPTVGLVLSGGSAKGIAHIGAIRVLEDAGIPVDVVAGTSMGAIVGSLYAIGYTPDQMEAIVTSRDWTGLFTDAVDRRETGLSRRLSEGRTVLALPIEDGAVALPTGLVAGQRILALLQRLTWPVATERDFRAFPRPFATVVVDAETGDGVRIDAGSLPLAVRGSMSLPSLFEPVEIAERRYIDGGFARNLPVEDAEALGADVLICVDVSAADTTAAAETTFLNILVDAAFYAADRELVAQRARCDLTIDPDVNGLSSFDFDAGLEWVERGAAAAEAQRPALDALALRLGNPKLRRPPPPEVVPRRVERVEVTGVTGVEARVLRRGLEETLGRSLVGPDDLDQAIAQLYATGFFQLITYQLDEGERGGVVLAIDARPENRDRLGFGFRFDTEYGAALLFELTLRNRLVFGSVTQVEVRLGDQTQLQARYLAGFGGTVPWTVAGLGSYLRLPLNFFAGGDRAIAAGTGQLLNAGLYAGPTLFGDVLTGVGPSLTYVRSAPTVGVDSLVANAETYLSLSGFAVADTRDRPNYTRRGVYAFAFADWAPGTGATFRRVAVSGEAAVALAPQVSLLGRGAVVQAWGTPTDDQRAYLGGIEVPSLLPGRFYPLYGAQDQELAGEDAVVGAAGLQVEVPRGVMLRGLFDAGWAGDRIAIGGNDYRLGYAVSAGMLTLAGPAELVLAGEAFAGRPRLLFRFGRTF
ncbi:MAG: patatin-like phospholipase family protein, partial [Bacteroidota bacterium]